jgi:NADPH:quinone reductase-like Zn-dependent oxidoreductase
MKAATRTKYGPPNVLTVSELPTPVPSSNEVLIKVHAVTVNRTDCAILTGKPFIMRLFTGMFKPKRPVPGTDFAGVVEQAGKDVTRFKPGDRVFGFNDMGLASQAEYMTLGEHKNIDAIPGSIGFEQAAASLEGAHYAINFLNKVKLQAGQKALVNGATGAIGSALVQFLKQVTATCAAKNMERVKALGADAIIDYEQQDFTKSGGQYDYVMDAVGKSTFGKCKRLLGKKGIYISSELGPWMQNPLLALVTPLGGVRKVIFPVPSNIKASMAYIKKLLEEGKFHPLMDRTWPLTAISEVYEYVMTGQKTGNAVVTIHG